MSCFNFGREDEDFPFEEEALRFFKGKIRELDQLEFSFPSWRKEFLERLYSFKNLLTGEEEEPLIDYLVSLVKRETFKGERLKIWLYLFNGYLFPLLERLVFYKVNEPLGREELSFWVREVKELPGRKEVSDHLDAVNKIISLLMVGGSDD
ncbi:hypothetical protein [Thermovibrio sp.]